jgi:hypothetical protein
VDNGLHPRPVRGTLPKGAPTPWGEGECYAVTLPAGGGSTAARRLLSKLLVEVPPCG